MLSLLYVKFLFRCNRLRNGRCQVALPLREEFAVRAGIEETKRHSELSTRQTEGALRATWVGAWVWQVIYRSWYGDDEPLVDVRGDVLPSTVLLRGSSAASGCLLEEDMTIGIDVRQYCPVR
jgi:hypothetical protein